MTQEQNEHELRRRRNLQSAERRLAFSQASLERSAEMVEAIGAGSDIYITVAGLDFIFRPSYAGHAQVVEAIRGQLVVETANEAIKLLKERQTVAALTKAEPLP